MKAMLMVVKKQIYSIDIVIKKNIRLPTPSCFLIFALRGNHFQLYTFS